MNPSKLLENQYFQLFQTLVQIGFIVAIIVFVGVAGDTALKIQDLKQEIREEKCIPVSAETFGDANQSSKVFQSLTMNKSNKSFSSTPSSLATSVGSDSLN